MRTGRSDWGALSGLRFFTVLDLSSNALRGEKIQSVQQRRCSKIERFLKPFSVALTNHARCLHGRAEFLAVKGGKHG